ncbi:hypothetical protein BC939DRAFT_264348 [Gamsiella multidivaricata]|uniref:uncharacterized protein n=1 Tax=Gamsiella multidivaricata TaxID=101098 RepID=UPI002220D6CF|nr:uncharacterized protein BC939DRAFT_264348 [Gamsiella multidivaricata]KAI7819427.1 hypothetical protein BC939DRAFT_264348 [Gamsiella multidivaricata]
MHRQQSSWQASTFLQTSTQTLATVEDVMQRRRLLCELLEKRKVERQLLLAETRLPVLQARGGRLPDQQSSAHGSGRKYKCQKLFSFKTRSRMIQHEPPDILKKHVWKPCKEPPENPLESDTSVPKKKEKEGHVDSESKTAGGQEKSGSGHIYAVGTSNEDTRCRNH